jgi:flagellar basal-body rod modification protein FlgD
MATIAGVATTDGTTQTKRVDPSKANELGRDDFLRLLVTQLKNQDPMKPMDNTEFVAELAQFSQLDQSAKQVQLLQQTIDNQNANMQVGLLPMVGRTVQVEGGLIQLGDSPATMTYALERDAASVKITIADKNNKVVRILDGGSQSLGKQQATWDGRNQTGALLPAGSYHYAVSATDVKGNPVTVATTSTLTITGVRMNNDQAVLVAGDEQIDRSSIIELR